MRTHTLTVAERDISTNDRLLVRGTANEDTCRLVLDDEWKGLIVHLTFEGSGEKVTPAVVDGECIVPWEVLQQAGEVTAYAVGLADGAILAHAKMDKPFVVVDSDADDNVKPTDPSLSEYQQALVDVKAATAKALESRVIHAEAETLDTGSDATANLVPEGGAQCLRLGIPKGDRGDCDFGILDIDDDGYLNAHYTTDKPSIKFELDGNDLRTVLEIADS